VNASPTIYEVVIVGAGPTGLTLANILGMHGVRTLLVERNAATVGEPRAVSIDDESLRTMQYIDLVDTVRSRIVEGYGSYYFPPRGGCFAKVVPETSEYGYPRRSAFRQPILEAQLRDGLNRFPSVQVRFSARVASIVDEGDGVNVTIVASDGPPDEVRAQYVVACDGAKSGIREALGIRMTGSTYDARWLIVDLAGSCERFRHTRVYCDPARPALALPGPEGTRRYEFMMLPGEKPEELLTEARVRSLLAQRSDEDAKLEIVRKAVYHFHARIAERWRSGRIFLAGDAAHLSPPFAGQGMNSGIRDAQNLGWKLACRLRGELGAGVLDSYEAERKPHARELIAMAVKMGHVMMPRSPLNALLVQSAFRLLALYRPARDYVMQMKYKPQPHFANGLMVGDAGCALRGRMLAQPVVERVDGSKTLLDHLLGKGFSVIEMDDGTHRLASHHDRTALDARLVRVIPRDQRFVASAETGAEQVRDVTGALGRLLDQAGVRGVVLRPDRYVAGCLPANAHESEADALLESIVRLSKSTSEPVPPQLPVELAIA
jgi:3-(3-hydroxy-phenyl)propionate hydroxylase